MKFNLNKEDQFINFSNSSVVDRSHLVTEMVNRNSDNLDLMSTLELVKLFSEEDLIPQKAVANVIEDISKAIDSISARLKTGGRLFYLGAGTSGRLGVLDAAECPPTFCTDPDLVQAIIAGGDSAIKSSSEGLEDIGEIAQQDLKNKRFNHNDCLIGITAGGTTEYVIKGLLMAMDIKALAIAISCVPNTQVPIPCDIDIRLLTGPELLTGSTRLKAGTATKMTLNIISTSVMIKLGKVYKNRMVDMSAKNSKLLDRSIRIISDLTGKDREESLLLLKNSNGSVKCALVMHFRDVDASEALSLLLSNDNYLRGIL